MQKFEIAETGESWETDINDTIEPETLEFIYQNGIKYLDATISSIKALSDSSLILLSYLLIIVGYVASHFVSSIIKDGFQEVDIMCVVFILYYAWIGWDIIIHIKPRKAYTTHTEPKALLQQRIIDAGYHNMKIVRCIEIQHDIYVNRHLMNKMFYKFESAIARTFIIPALYRFISKVIHCFFCCCSTQNHH
jgi:hypothetical protein